MEDGDFLALCAIVKTPPKESHSVLGAGMVTNGPDLN
jgi:hypothetical protein